MKSFIATAVALVALSSAMARPPVDPAIVHVRLDTAAGSILLALDARRAPRTVANFMAYVDDGRLDGTEFYRAFRGKLNSKAGFIQGGIGTDMRRRLPPVPLEPTSMTGLRHIDGTISMARAVDPNSGSCNFSILVGSNPSLDAHGGNPGYAAFGKVEGSMATVQRILAMPTGGGKGAMKGQMLVDRVPIIRAVRLDGTPRPTGRAKPWLLNLPW